MAENLYSPNQQVMTPEGKENFDRIFKKPTFEEEINKQVENVRRRQNRWKDK